MIKFIAGFVLGIMVATVGLQGMVNMSNKAVVKTQEVIKDAAK